MTDEFSVEDPDIECNLRALLFEREAEIERLTALLIDTVNSMERGGFHVDLQKRIRAALKDTKP